MILTKMLDRQALTVNFTSDIASNREILYEKFFERIVLYSLWMPDRSFLLDPCSHIHLLPQCYGLHRKTNGFKPLLIPNAAISG